MARIKNWKRNYGTERDSNYNASGKYYNNMIWTNTLNEQSVFVWSPRYISANMWQFSDGVVEKNFRTKKQAVDYAMAYMRSNP